MYLYRDLPGINILGYGYRVFDQYADPKSITQRLFEMEQPSQIVTLGNDRFKIYRYQVAEVIVLNASKLNVVSGESIESYLRDISIDLKATGSYQAFSGSVSTSFSSHLYQKSTNYYTTIRNTIQKYLVKLKNIQNMKLQSNFKTMLNSTINPVEVFDKYGSHYLAQFVIGGRLDYSTVTTTTTFQSIQAVKVAARVSYESKIASASLDSNNQFRDQINSFRAHSQTYINSVGGDPGEALKVKDSQNPKQHYQKWLDSLRNDFTLCDFTTASLVPIWDLCETQARKLQMMKAFPQYATSFGFKGFIQRPISLRYTYDLSRKGDSTNSNSNHDCVYYKPNLRQNQSWFGHYIAKDNVCVALPVAISIESNVFVSPASYQKVWTNQGSGNGRRYSIWNPVPPQGYVALGCILKFEGENYGPPGGDEVSHLVCVHQSLTSLGQAAEEYVWSDQGSKAPQDVTLFPVVPKDKTGLPSFTFHANNKPKNVSGNPTFPTAHVLKSSKIVFGNNSETKIFIKYAQEKVKCGQATGLGSKANLSIFKPAVGPNQYWFGHYVVPLRIDNLLTTLPYTTSSEYVHPPIDYERVWTDQGSGSQKDYSCWRPVPPPGFVALGYIFRFGVNNYNPPSGSEIDGLVCVKQQFCVQAEAQAHRVWTDDGSDAQKDLTIWNVIPSSSEGFPIQSFYCQGYNESHNPNPTTPRAHVLKFDRVLLI